MKYNELLIGIGMFVAAQILSFFQLNGQFIWTWAKDNPWTMSLLGFPISYVLIIATKFIVAGFDGLLWPGRLVGFGSGMIVMAILTWCVLGEGISTKTLVSLALATTLVFIQILWK